MRDGEGDARYGGCVTRLEVGVERLEPEEEEGDEGKEVSPTSRSHFFEIKRDSPETEGGLRNGVVVEEICGMEENRDWLLLVRRKRTRVGMTNTEAREKEQGVSAGVSDSRTSRKTTDQGRKDPELPREEKLLDLSARKKEGW